MKNSNVTIRKRLAITLFFSILLYFLLLARFAYVQLFAGQELMDKAENLWTRDVPFDAKRGQILDRNGHVLAYNVSVPSVMLIPSQIVDKDETAFQLAHILEIDRDKIDKLVRKRQLLVWIAPEGRRISEEKAQAIGALQLPGVLIVEDSQRYYPHGELAAHILGFTGVDNQGLTGVERQYDQRLVGNRGYISFYADAKGKMMPNQSERFLPPRDGEDLYLTIDINIQKIIERELDSAVQQFQPDNILAIAMDPGNGEILGMASRPTYHPGQYREYESEIYNRNLPIWKTYEPGSTFKVITLAAAIEEGQVDLHRDHFFDPGYAMVGGARIRCWKHGGHGSQSYLQVVENSCNPGFIAMGQRLGKDRLFDYIRRFGFGQKTGVDLPGEGTGILFKLDRVGPVELATTSFGQGVSVTPIQQVAAISAAINGGYLVQPHVGKQWVNPESHEVTEIINVPKGEQVISEETSTKVREALESVVANGSGRAAYLDGFRVGGKTGTAQKVGPNGRYLANEHIVSFIGFAPADEPAVVIYVAVDNPSGIQFGSVVSAPVVQKIMEDVLEYLEVEPRKNQLPKQYRWGDPILYEVPDLRGMSIDELRQSYFQLPIEVTGHGEQVIMQSPAPGTKVEEGKRIRIYLGDNLQEKN
ncbi:stage V sporulation protein D [Rubeoparvulum massiliense]|uniref:stage V sporulation protein D n=1 Tax=Rubeoparvulum massiliense TaxID=1631346 RepID=UPI00065E887F|nr:stage V sporulation protein D [Rubeoparvulum massiliense]